MATERAAGRLNPYLGHLTVPIEPSTNARSLMSRAFNAPSTSQGVLPRGGQSHVAHADLAKAVDVPFAVPGSVVSVRTWRLAEQRHDLLHRLDSEGRIAEVLLGAGHGRKDESAAQPCDPPGQSELDGLAHLAADNRIELRDVQV